MKCLVTGGAGFIGSHISEELLKQRHKVIVLDNLFVGKKENVPADAVFVKGDIRDCSLLRDVLSGVDVVFHNAAFVSIRGSFNNLEDDLDINCRGTLNLLQESADSGIKKFIFASSMAIYGAPSKFPVDETAPLLPNSPYGLSKVRGEMYCNIFHRQVGLQCIVLRYFNVFGPRQTPSSYVGVLTTFINQALSQKPLTVYGDGKQKRDFISVKDVARINVKLLDFKESDVFNVCSGSEITIDELANKVLEYFPDGKKEYLDAPAGEIPRMIGDNSKSRQILEFKTTETIKENIPSLIEEWKKKKV